MTYDYCIIGGGIVGLATAMQLLARDPGASLVLVEKESVLAAHQTGHNSGVIHAGVYYAPGSLKAELCRAGAAATKAFCRSEGIPFRTCGKLIVATNEAERQRMLALEKRAQLNGIEVIPLDRAGLAEKEPEIEGIAALHVPASAIVDYRAVSAAMGRRIEAAGGEIRLGEAVRAIREEGSTVRVGTTKGSIAARLVVACAGLQSDRLARLAGLPITHRIVPFRGEYYRVARKHEARINHLIYPTPDPALPFLGIHLTLMIDGSVTVGPNAVLGLSREREGKWAANATDLRDMAAFPGFWKMAAGNWRTAASEFVNSVHKRGYLEQCRKYYPALEIDDLEPYPAGTRAQAVEANGKMVEDFLMVESARMLHVCNAPSPAATSALPIASRIVDRLEAKRAALR